MIFNDVSLRLQQEKDLWEASVKSKEMSGNLILPKTLASGKPMVMDLDYLQYQMDKPDPNEQIPEPFAKS